MKDFKIDSVGVVGLGLIGASILKDIQAHAPNIERFGYSSGRELEIALNDNLIVAASFSEMINRCDLIIISTPISSVISVAKRIKNQKKSKKNLIVIDVSSVKKEISKKFKELTNNVIDFIPTHPMGGSEKNGYEGARRGLFQQKPWLICAEQSDKTREVQNLIARCCGAKVRYLSPEFHDQYVAVASHMILDLSSFLFEFVGTKHPEALGIAGESFITTTRLASDNPKMLADINQQNFDFIKDVFMDFIAFLQIKLDNPKELNQEFFTDNKLSRDSWLHHRNRTKE